MMMFLDLTTALSQFHLSNLLITQSIIFIKDKILLHRAMQKYFIYPQVFHRYVLYGIIKDIYNECQKALMQIEAHCFFDKTEDVL